MPGPERQWTWWMPALRPDGTALCLLECLPLNQNQFALYFTCNFGCAVMNQHVYFTAHAKFGQVNARFNGKTSIGDDLALVLGLQVVHVGAIAMDVLANGVSRAMYKKFAVSGVGDVLARGLVHFPSRNAAFARIGFLDLFYTCVTAAADDVENFHVLVSGSANHAGPRDVIVDGVRSVLLAPDVQQDEVAFLDFR